VNNLNRVENTLIDGIQREVVGRASWFRRFICYSLDSSTIGTYWRHFCELGSPQRMEKITIYQALIAKQFGVSVEGVMDAVNALIKESITKRL
jgi:hypothetical protein